MTVKALPDAGAIAGLDSVCAGSSITLSDTASGGVWISSDAGIATVNSGGVVTGISAGSANITYSSATFSCGTVNAVHTVTVNGLPSAGTIVGLDSVCAGAAVTLSDTATGGTWSSSAAGTATVNSFGVVTGIAAGTATVSYTVATLSCGSASVQQIVTVKALPDAGVIVGLDSVCAGSAITLSDTASGGTWSSSAAGIATINSGGVVTGISAGSANITYSSATFSCGTLNVVHPVTVNGLPSAGTIVGLDSVCAGAAVTLSDTATGGTWSSSAAGTATVDAFGGVTGLAAGTATISYTVATFSCGSASVLHSITVNPQPNGGAITGADSVCAGALITLSETASGGTWSSSALGTATVNGFGVVTGVAAGSADITYTSYTFSCGAVNTIHTVNVNALPDAGVITGADSVCAGASVSLTNTLSGGAWSTANGGIATVNAAGMVTGIGAGVVAINYTATTFSCGSALSSHTVTVDSLPVVAVITGSPSVCIGNSTSLADATPGGSWTSSVGTVASIDAFGNVTSGNLGTTVISYTVTSISACTTAASIVFTVSGPPVLSAISGPLAVARLSSILLTDTASGGVWTSSNTALATVNSITGLVTGVNMGVDTITYTKTSGAGCSSSVTYNIVVANSLTSSTILPIGSATLCHGNAVNLITVTAGGATDLSYQWYIDGFAISGATNTNYVTDTFGHFTVMISNVAGSNMLTGVNVVLPPNPVVNITGGNVLYTGSFTNYQWYLNDSAIAGATSSIYTEHAIGNYMVIVSDGNGCYDTSAVFPVLEITSVGTLNVINIKLYPNPATSVIRIDAPVPVNVSVLTADGKLMIRQSGATAVNVRDLPSGMYMVMVYSQDNVLLKVDKFIKAD